MTAVDEAAELIATRARETAPIVSFTGAGISSESGIPTFRGETGIWREQDPEEVATLEGFQSDPERAWRFHERLRQMCLDAPANRAHLALVWIANTLNGNVATPVITQNIDGLHQAAGSNDVIELHGSAHRIRCVECGFSTDNLPREFAELPPRCECGGLMRPDVVWFGEQLPREALEEARQWSREAGAMLIVGTSAMVQPAASLPALALRSGAALIEVNPQPTALSAVVDVALRSPAGEIMPELAEALSARLSDTCDSGE